MMILATLASAIKVAAEGDVLMPGWLISILISLIIALVTSVSVMSGTKANLEVRAKRNEEDIKSLQNDKVSKSEFQLVYDILKKIEKKIDEHIKEG